MHRDALCGDSSYKILKRVAHGASPLVRYGRATLAEPLRFVRQYALDAWPIARGTMATIDTPFKHDSVDASGVLRGRLWLTVVAALVTAVVAAFAQRPLWTFSILLVVSNVLVAVAWVTTASLFDRRRHGNYTVGLFFLSGLFWILAWSGGWGKPWHLIAFAGDSLFWTAIACGLVFYPLGRPRDRAEAFYVLFFVSAVGTQLAVNLSWLRTNDIVVERWLAWSSIVTVLPSISVTANNIVSVILAAGFIALVARRWIGADALGRRELWPYIAAGATAGIAGGPLTWLTTHAQLVSAENVTLLSLLATTISVLAPPVSFGAVALNQRLLRARVAERLTRGVEDNAAIEHALQEVLLDPALQVHYWIPERREYVTSTGAPSRIEAERHERMHVRIDTLDGHHLATIEMTNTLQDRSDVISAVVDVSRVMIDKTRLQAKVLAELHAVRGAQRRLLSLEKQERRQLADDLHDGVQQRLVAQLWTIERLGRSPSASVPTASLDEVRCQLELALDELRGLANGIDPTMAGLAPAIERQVMSFPLPVDVHVDADGVSAQAATAAYFVVCEGMANALKHASATRLTVRACVVDQRLDVEVCDDGAGGADATGRGLTALADRVTAFGGTLRIHSTPDTGTRLRASLPDDETLLSGLVEPGSARSHRSRTQPQK